MSDGAADVLVIGGGIAGAGAAYALAESCRVVLLEAEEQPGYHTTGRSAALYSARYRNPLIRGLSVASGAFLKNPPPGFAEHPLLVPRGLLVIARSDQIADLEAQFNAEQFAAGIVRRVDAAEACALAPHLDPAYVAAGMYLADAQDIDVNGLHRGFLRGMARRGGRLVANARVSALRRAGDAWLAETAAGTFRARAVVNAAGAWADEVARLAGLRPIGLQPMRRTAITVDPPAGQDPSGWPMVMDAVEQFYFKPEAGRVLASPCDETPTPPCDAQPDEYDVAVAVELLQRASTIRVGRITHRWAGLRSFVADRMPVAGMAPDGAGFCWLAGQGGFGIMTSHALGRVAAAAVLETTLPQDLAAQGISLAALSPERVWNGTAA